MMGMPEKHPSCLMFRDRNSNSDSLIYIEFIRVIQRNSAYDN